MNRQVNNFLIALGFFMASCLVSDYTLSSAFMAAAIFMGIYSAVMSIDTRKQDDIFKHLEMPPPVVRKEVVVKHEHHHHKYTQCTEGVEVSKTMPNGTTVNVRHVRKWQ